MATVAAPAVTSSASVSTHRVFPLRILVDSDVVGAIIGRSGSTIRSITQQTKAKIDVHREESPEQKEKVITISGPPENCSEACYRIMKICHEEYNSHNSYREDVQYNRDDEQCPNTAVDTLHILAPSSLIGRLIGRGGSSIKKLMEQTSTKIKISVNSITESTGEHTITIVGSLDKIRHAEKLISFKLRAAYFSDMNLTFQGFNQQPYMFNNIPIPYVAQGSYAPHQNPLLTSMVTPQHGANSMPRSIQMNHTHHQGQIPSQMYPGPPAYLPLYPNMTVHHSAAGGLLGFNSVIPRYERETVYIYIPSTMVGAIIGKSGTAIKEMISASGATIKVATTPPANSTPTSCTATESVETPAEEDKSNTQSEENTPEKSAESQPSSSDTTSTKDNTLDTNGDSESQPVVRKNNSRSKITSLSDSSGLRKVTVIGYPSSQYTAQYLIYRKVSIESGKSDTSLMVEIHVPSHLVGKIIGKGGTAVKNLQMQTRTTIRLPEEKPAQNHQPSGHDESNGNGLSNDTVETIVHITGEFEGSQAAQRHIRKVMNKKL